jgi:hypothetical protein
MPIILIIVYINNMNMIMSRDRLINELAFHCMGNGEVGSTAESKYVPSMRHTYRPPIARSGADDSFRGREAIGERTFATGRLYPIFCADLETSEFIILPLFYIDLELLTF